MKTLICDCNHTMRLDAQALSQALDKTAGASSQGLQTVHSALCRRQAGAFQRAALETTQTGDELLVACTQEQELFLALNQHTEGSAGIQERPIRFVNLRETAGWTRHTASPTPKMAALLAVAQLPQQAPVGAVSYRSEGRLLIIGSAQAAQAAALMLEASMDVTVLIDTPGEALPSQRGYAVHYAKLTQLQGWLGAFTATWQVDEPIDLDLCTRCNACITVCPEGAIGHDYRVDRSRCTSHRDCVRVCEAAGAIDFDRSPQEVREHFDLVLDLRAHPAFAQAQPPQGYLHTAGEAQALMPALWKLRDLVGEFEKPKFFDYQAKLCAHSRNEQIGCTACIDVCSAGAIRSEASLKGKSSRAQRPARGPEDAAQRPTMPGGGIAVEPHLCVGCGACGTVCPSGALSFATPTPADLGKRVRTLVSTYARAGGKDAAILIHSASAGSALIDALGQQVQRQAAVPGKPAKTSGAASPLMGMPPRVLPLSVWHTASVGLEVWLSAIAWGASQVWVLLTHEEAKSYREALGQQMAVGQAVLSTLGYSGTHLRIIECPDSEAASLRRLDEVLRETAGSTVSSPATYALPGDKRAGLDLAIDHLIKLAPTQPAPEAVTLPSAGTPWGSLQVDTTRCTLCLSCVGACPESALADNPDKPQLNFVERNCVQCGLCATTCPEQAITLQPRLWLADGGKARRAARVLHEATPFHCVRCHKPFGTLQAVEKMLDKLGGHSAFQGAAAERLKMCSDCRVVDMFSNTNEVRITDL